MEGGTRWTGTRGGSDTYLFNACRLSNLVATAFRATQLQPTQYAFNNDFYLTTLTTTTSKPTLTTTNTIYTYNNTTTHHPTV